MDELTSRLARLTPEQRERLRAGIRNTKALAPKRTVRPLPRDGRKFPLSFAQQRLWLLQQIEPGNPTYNHTGGLRLTGDIDQAAMSASLQGLVERHETLRTRFIEDEDGPWQIVEPNAELRLERQDVADLEELANCAAAEGRMPFDLQKGPLLRARLLRLGPRDHALLLTLHHIVCDGWSLGVLLREWSELYGAARGGRVPRLKPLPVQYADYAVWQREWLAAPEFERQMNYWRERLADIEPLNLATGRAPPSRAIAEPESRCKCKRRCARASSS
jgi:hypothetical protein